MGTLFCLSLFHFEPPLMQRISHIFLSYCAKSDGLFVQTLWRQKKVIIIIPLELYLQKSLHMLCTHPFCTGTWRNHFVLLTTKALSKRGVFLIVHFWSSCMHNVVLSGGFGVICSNYLYLTAGAAAWHRGETIQAESKKPLLHLNAEWKEFHSPRAVTKELHPQSVPVIQLLCSWHFQGC